MAKESRTDTLTLVCTLDNTRNVCHNKRVTVTHLDNTEIWLESCEGVVCNLRFCSRNNREQSTLTCIREAHKTYISKHLELEDKCTLIALLTRLCIARSLICSGLEVPVTQTSATTLEQYELLSVLCYLADILQLSFTILSLYYATRNSTEWHRDNDILGIFTA